MKTKITLDASLRQVKGSKVKQLRKMGIIPANVFGKGIESVSVQLNEINFRKIYDQAGETSVVDLKIDDQAPRPILIGNIAFDPIGGGLHHVDLRQVDLKEKIVTHIPITFIGESTAVKEFNATIVESLEEIEVEALPTDLPESVEVDISTLVNIDDNITVGDLKLGDKIEILTDPSILIVSAQAVTEEVEEETPTEGVVEAETTEQSKPEETEAKAE